VVSWGGLGGSFLGPSMGFGVVGWGVAVVVE